DGPERRARFGREASLLEGLAHPHIVRYVAHGELPNGELYLAMEWLDGADLQQRLDRKSTRLNSSHGSISYAVFCLKKKKNRTYADMVLVGTENWTERKCHELKNMDGGRSAMARAVGIGVMDDADALVG